MHIKEFLVFAEYASGVRITATEDNIKAYAHGDELPITGQLRLLKISVFDDARLDRAAEIHVFWKGESRGDAPIIHHQFNSGMGYRYVAVLGNEIVGDVDVIVSGGSPVWLIEQKDDEKYIYTTSRGDRFMIATHAESEAIAIDIDEA